MDSPQVAGRAVRCLGTRISWQATHRFGRSDVGLLVVETGGLQALQLLECTEKRSLDVRFVASQLGERVGLAGVDAESPPERAKRFGAETGLGCAVHRWRVRVIIDHPWGTLDGVLECEQLLVGGLFGLEGDCVLEPGHEKAGLDLKDAPQPPGAAGDPINQ